MIINGTNNETANSPIHEFKVLHKGQRAFWNGLLVLIYYFQKTFLALLFHFKDILKHFKLVVSFFDVRNMSRISLFGFFPWIMSFLEYFIFYSTIQITKKEINSWSILSFLKSKKKIEKIHGQEIFIVVRFLIVFATMWYTRGSNVKKNAFSYPLSPTNSPVYFGTHFDFTLQSWATKLVSKLKNLLQH